MRVAITGATGLVGEFLVPHLLKRKHEVQALWHNNKSATKKFDDHPGLTWLQGDLRDEASLAQLVAHCDSVVHAALEHIPGRYRGGEGDDPERFEDINLRCVERFFKSLRESQVSRTVFISSRAVFDGHRNLNGSLDDESPTRPETLYGKIKAKVEVMGDSLEDIGFCTLRPTGIYGQSKLYKDNKWFNLIQQSIDRRSSLKDLSNQMRTEVHGEDVANAIELLLTSPIEVVEHRRFNCSDIAVSQAQLARLVQRIQQGGPIDWNALLEGIPPTNPMSCPGLKSLGWCPGGWAKLERTLQTMVAAEL